jgi:hypothetical protein
MNKLLIIWCLVSTALFCFTHASPTAYKRKVNLVHRNEHWKLSSVYEKRDNGVGQRNMGDHMSKRDVPDERALSIAQAKADEPNATKPVVLQTLFELLIGKSDPIAARAADVITKTAQKSFLYWRDEIKNIFQGNPINADNDDFFNLLFDRPRNYRKAVIGIVLALIPQQNHRLLGHPDLDFILNDISYIDGFVLELGQALLGLGEEFTYNGEFSRQLVIEVIVAAVAVATGEAQTPHDIPSLMSHLS